MKKGLVIGKFYPPHKGHSFLIDTALEHVDYLDVLVCDHPSITIPATKRQKWLQTIHPSANVQIIEDIGKDEDSEAWAEHTIKYLGYAPDVVFTSEDYGETYAACMGCQHILVDKQRKTIPISGTIVRSDVVASWDYLNPLVRKNYIRRVCVLGAESTGTTTLTKALAEYYKAAWVPEYGRYYTESLLCLDHEWHSQEFTHIAEMQQAMENQLAGESKGLLFCDTNAFATRLWHKRYMGFWSEQVDQVAVHDAVDLYILTGDEIPFEQDGIRDGEHIRHAMNEEFRHELATSGVPYIEVHGSLAERLKVSKKAINNLMNRKLEIC